MPVDEMEHDGCGFGNDQLAVNQGGNAAVRIDLEIRFRLLGVVSSIDKNEAISDSDRFEQHVRRCVGIRREIMKLIHRSFPVPVAIRFCTRSPDPLLTPPNATETNCSIATALSFITEMVGGPRSLALPVPRPVLH